MRSTTHGVLGLLTAFAFAGWACSGHDASPVSPSSTSAKGGSSAQVSAKIGEGRAVVASPAPSPAPSGAPTASPSPALPTVPGLPGVSAACPLGKGTVEASCDRGAALLLDTVDLAIGKAVAEKPALFDFTSVVGEGGYKVLDYDGFLAAVITNLQGMGYCAGYDLKELQVKNSNDYSEQYDIVLSSGHIRRGTGSYRATCVPAAFPLDATDLISYVRVGFYGFKCADGVAAPNNNDGKLPMGCVGLVTATPKKVDGTDVDPRIHGPEVFWDIQQEGGVIDIDTMDGQVFNQLVSPREPGHFTLCAEVKGVEGCLHGEVVP